MSARVLVFAVVIGFAPLVAAAQQSTPRAARAHDTPAVLAAAQPSPAARARAVVLPHPDVKPAATLAEPGAQSAQSPQAGQPAAPAVAQTPDTAGRGERGSARAQIRTQEDQDRAEALIRERRENRSKGVNIRIDATVIESHGDQVVGRKVLSLTLVDGGNWGSVRSSQQVSVHPKGGPPAVFNWRAAPLNMDARAFLRDDGRIRVELTVEYRGGSGERPTPGGNADEDTIDEGIKQSVAVVLESGKPLIVAQSADAVGDRRVALEVKATMLK